MPSGRYSCNSYAISKDNTPQGFVLFVQFVFSKIKRQILLDCNIRLYRNFYPIMGIKKSAHRAVLRESRMLSTSQVLLVSIGSRYRGVVLNCPSILAFFIVVASSQISPHSVFECKITNLLAYKQIFKG